MHQQTMARAQRVFGPKAESISRPHRSSSVAFADNRSGVVVLHKLSDAMNASPNAAAQRKLADAMLNSPRAAMQRRPRYAMPGASTQSQTAMRGSNPTAGAQNGVIQAQWWKTLFGVGAKQKTFAKSRFIKPESGTKYRVDLRPPHVIAKEGFFPKSIRMPMNEIEMSDIQKYQQSAINNPGVVSTAETMEGAETFARQLGFTTPGKKYIYKINAGGLAEYPQKENIPWWQRLFYAEQAESLIAGGIDPSRVEFEKEMYTDESDLDTPSGFIE